MATSIRFNEGSYLTKSEKIRLNTLNPNYWYLTSTIDKRATQWYYTYESLIEYLQKNCPFKIIDSEQSCNVYREYITNITKIKHIRCQNLLCSTTPKPNIRPDIDNLIVKISDYDINGLVVNGYSVTYWWN